MLTEEQKLIFGGRRGAISALLQFLEEHCKIFDRKVNYRLPKDNISKRNGAVESISDSLKASILKAIRVNCKSFANAKNKNLTPHITDYLKLREKQGGDAIVIENTKKVKFGNFAINIDEDDVSNVGNSAFVADDVDSTNSRTDDDDDDQVDDLNNDDQEEEDGEDF